MPFSLDLGNLKGDIKVLQKIDSQEFLDKLQIAFNNMQRDIKIAKGEQSR